MLYYDGIAAVHLCCFHVGCVGPALLILEAIMLFFLKTIFPDGSVLENVFSEAED